MKDYKILFLAAIAFFCLVSCDELQQEIRDAKLTPEDKVKSMLLKPVSAVDASVLCPIFNFGSEFTDLQRERIENDIKGKVVRWRLQVYEVSSTSEKNVYRVQTQSCTPKSKVESFNVLEQKLLDSMRELGGQFGESLAKNLEQNHNVPTFLTLVARNDEEVNKINGLKTGDWIEVQGEITGTFMRVIELNPVIFYSQNGLNIVKAPQKQDISTLSSIDIESQKKIKAEELFIHSDNADKHIPLPKDIEHYLHANYSPFDSAKWNVNYASTFEQSPFFSF